LFIRVDDFVISPASGELPPRGKQLIIFSLTQKELPSFWEGEINCKISWKTQKDNLLLSSLKAEADITSENMFPVSQELKSERAMMKTDMLFICVKKSSNIKVE
jgi:hypothetical protein